MPGLGGDTSLVFQIPNFRVKGPAGPACCPSGACPQDPLRDRQSPLKSPALLKHTATASPGTRGRETDSIPCISLETAMLPPQNHAWTFLCFYVVFLGLRRSQHADWSLSLKYRGYCLGRDTAAPVLSGMFYILIWAVVMWV